MLSKARNHSSRSRAPESRPSLCRLSGCLKRPPPDNSSPNQARRWQAASRAVSLSPLLSCIAPEPSRERVCPRCVLRRADPYRASRARRARRTHSPRALVRVRPPARPVPGPWNLAARALPSSRSTPRPAHCFGRPPLLAAARTALWLLALYALRTNLAAGSTLDSAVCAPGAPGLADRHASATVRVVLAPTCNQLRSHSSSPHTDSAAPWLALPPIPAPLACFSPVPAPPLETTWLTTGQAPRPLARATTAAARWLCDDAFCAAAGWGELVRC
jgi:hypothetical protein